MEIFVIHKGEQSGPHRIFELRDMIAAGKFETTDSGWYKGLDSWKPLGEIDALRDAIPEDTETVQAPPETPATPIDEPAERGVLPPVIPGAGDVPQQTSVLFTPEALGMRLWVRFGARLVDFSPLLILFFGMSLDEVIRLSVDDTPRGMDFSIVLITLAWFILDAGMISMFGTTPGKLIAGLTVVDRDRQLPNTKTSLVRSLMVFAFGWGFGLLILTIFSLVISFLRAKKTGVVFWDDRAQTRVLGTPISGLRIALLIAIPVGAMFFASSIYQDKVLRVVEIAEQQQAAKSAPADPPIQ